MKNNTKNKYSLYPWILFSIFFIIEIIFIIAYNPGLMSPDSFDQLKQARSSFFTNWHPLFSTLYVYIFDKLFGSPIGISIANTAIFSLFLILIINTFKSNKKLLLIVLGFYCIMPIYYLYNISLWKDVPYSYFFALSIIFLYRIIINYKLKDLVLFLICILFVSLFRHNGITVTLAAIISISLLSKIKTKVKIISILSLIISIILIRIILTTFLPGARTPIIINKSNFYVVLMSHMASLPHNGDKALIKELDPLSPVISPVMLTASYYPGYITTLLFTPSIGLDHTKVLSHKKLILKTFIKISLKHPILITKSVFIQGSLIWSPITLKNSGYYVVEPGGDVCTEGLKAYSQYRCDEYKKQNIKHINFIPGIDEKITIFINKYSSIFFVRPIFYIAMIVISIIWWTRKNKNLWKKIIILLLPLIFQTITMFFLVQAQDFRYHYGLVIIAPVFLLIMSGLNKNK